MNEFGLMMASLAAAYLAVCLSWPNDWRVPDDGDHLCFHRAMKARVSGTACAVIVTVRIQLAIRSRLQVVTLVERGALRPNALGDIRLPRSLALASINGHVYLGTCAVNWDPQSHPHAVQSVIFFPTVSTAYSVNWQDGKPDRQEYQMEGYIFAGKSLASDADVEFSNPVIDQLVGPFDTTTKPGWYYGTPWESD